MFGWPGLLAELQRYLKVWNEDRVFPLTLARYLAQFTGCAEQGQRHVWITREGERLLADERAGELYARLFRTFFRECNLAFLDTAGECRALQETVAYTLYMVGRFTDDWISPDELPALVFLPSVVVPHLPVEPYGSPSLVLKTRILRPLSWFGLLEFESNDEPPEYFSRIIAVRKTALFDQFIEFRLE